MTSNSLRASRATRTAIGSSFIVPAAAQSAKPLARSSARWDGKGRWADEGPDNDLRYMPMGLLSLYGVPFRVIDPATNGGCSCVILRAGLGPGTRTDRDEYPRSVSISVGHRTNAFYFLLGVGWGIEGPVATLTVHYADDHKFVPARKDRFRYAVQWVNPRSGVPVQSLEFTGAGRTPIPILLSVTGHGT